MRHLPIFCSLVLLSSISTLEAAPKRNLARPMSKVGKQRLRLQQKKVAPQKITYKTRWQMLRRMARLAKDPAHGNKMTKTSKREAYVGTLLEMSGKLLAPVTREKTGKSEFVDARGQMWDVKAFNSKFPPKKGGFVLERVLKKLAGEFRGGEKVILDSKDLSKEHRTILEKAIKQRKWEKNVIWF